MHGWRKEAEGSYRLRLLYRNYGEVKMSVAAMIETDHGECFRLWHDDGLMGGQGIASFLRSLLIYCDKDDSDFEETRQWFARLDLVSEIPLCELAKPLLTGHYFGYWDYGEDEYEYFSSRSRNLPLSEEEFKQTIQKLRKLWIPANDMLNVADGIIKIFMKADLEATWWYDPQETLDDFRALKKTVEIANRAPECIMRIQFS